MLSPLALAALTFCCALPLAIRLRGLAFRSVPAEDLAILALAPALPGLMWVLA